MSRTVSIRSSLLRNLCVMIVVTGVAILATTFLGSRRAVRGMSESIVGRTLETVEARLDGFFQGPAQQLRVTAEHAALGLLDLTEEERALIESPDERVDRLRYRRNRALAPIIDTWPQISSLMLADSRGREHMLLRDNGGWRNRLTRLDEWGGEVRWLEWKDDDATPRDRRERLDYDPRRRPWFEGAVAARDAGGTAPIHWTDPYPFFTTKEPGITVSSTFEAGDGLDRVVGFDLLLKDISEFTRALRVGSRGIVGVLTEDRRLIGLPRLPRFDDPAARASAYLKLPEDLGLTLINDTAEASREYRDQDAATVPFESGGERWWCSVTTYSLSSERRLRIAIIVPEADLLGNLWMQRWIMLGIVAIVLVVGIGRAVLLSRRFSAPIEALVAESDRMRGGDLEPGPPVESPVLEVRRLAQAHDQMREGLKAKLRLEKIERDLDLARDIQRGLLPKGPPAVPGFEIAGWNQAADQTGGDYFDWLSLPDGRTIVTLADVTGHGIGPALIVAVCRAYMRAAAGISGRPLSAAVSSVNDLLYADTPPERFVTAVVGVIDPAEGSMSMVSAGHGPLYFYEVQTGAMHKWEGDVPPLGVVDGMEFPPPREIRFAPGDVLVLTTDGFFEWPNPAGEQFGTSRLEAFVRDHHALAPEQFIEKLYEIVLGHADGTRQDDDLTAVVIRRM
ncbi:MAG: hypothetical protein CMJ18_26390 [Phycisphaeraceae bacterium]|nr:hypothetical protein [Phycisphaeraceae bacterium]